VIVACALVGGGCTLLGTLDEHAGTVDASVPDGTSNDASTFDGDDRDAPFEAEVPGCTPLLPGKHRDIDESYGRAGVALYDRLTAWSWGAAVDHHGRVTIGSIVFQSGVTRAAIGGFLSDGNPDPRFGDGMRRLDVPGSTTGYAAGVACRVRAAKDRRATGLRCPCSARSLRLSRPRSRSARAPGFSRLTRFALAANSSSSASASPSTSAPPPREDDGRWQYLACVVIHTTGTPGASRSARCGIDLRLEATGGCDVGVVRPGVERRFHIEQCDTRDNTLRVHVDNALDLDGDRDTVAEKNEATFTALGRQLALRAGPVPD
jgi:hypothetical protein